MRIVNSVILIFGIIVSFQAVLSPKKQNIQKINNALIFDLFMNYEMTEKNGNLSTIIDYFPNTEKTGIATIEVVSNMGGEQEFTIYTFKSNGLINELIFQVNTIVYRYDYIYEGDLLTYVNIAGKNKISFSYDNKGRLITIIREKGEAKLEYNFEYLEELNKANILLFVVQGTKRTQVKSPYYVTWNDKLKLESFSFGVYISKNMKYSLSGDLISYSFTNVSADNIPANWEYILDEKGNWIEKKDKDLFFKRTIKYD